MQRVTALSFATGNPPLLTHYLQEGLGITIKRKKMQLIVKQPLKVSNFFKGFPGFAFWFISCLALPIFISLS